MFKMIQREPARVLNSWSFSFIQSALSKREEVIKLNLRIYKKVPSPAQQWHSHQHAARISPTMASSISFNVIMPSRPHIHPLYSNNEF
jgi:hypothetical protein